VYPGYLLLVEPLDDEICPYTPEPDECCCKCCYEECWEQDNKCDADAHDGEDDSAEDGQKERGHKGEDEDSDGKDQEETDGEGREGDLGEDEGLSQRWLAGENLQIDRRGGWRSVIGGLTASIGFSVANCESLAESWLRRSGGKKRSRRSWPLPTRLPTLP